MLSLSLLIVNNENLLNVNSETHGFNTRQNSHLYQPQANLLLHQNEAYCSGTKVFNSLLSKIKNLSCDVKRFKLDLNKYLHLKSCYILKEYFKSAKSLTFISVLQVL